MHIHMPHHVPFSGSLVGMALGVTVFPVIVLLTLFLIAR
ncbi:MAG: hypothetical protein QOJ99_5487 [Bryobacterales bacterium]|nr:hypothetical protein [Bryobacterales bacterium]